MVKCVCKGNWRDIVTEVEPHLNKVYIDNKYRTWYFLGVLWAEDDFYYLFKCKNGKMLYSTCCLRFDLTLKYNGLREKI